MFVIAPAIFISCILFFLVIVASLGALFAKNDSEAGVWLGHGRAPEGYFTLADRRYDRRIANRRTV